MESVLQKIVDAAKELLKTRYAALGVVDEEHRRLTRFVVSGISEEEIKAIDHWPHGLGLLGELIHSPHPMRVDDISKDPRSIGFPPNHPPMTNFLGVPVIRGNRVLGNFYMTDKLNGERFTDDDEEILSLFATHAAIALENARLYTETDAQLKAKVVEVERAERQSRVLADLGAMLLHVAPDADPPLEAIAERASESLADAVAICLVDPAHPRDTTTIAVFHQIPERRKATRELVERSWQSLADVVLLKGTPFLFSQSSPATGESVFDLPALESRRFSAVLAVPIATRQTTYGVLVSAASRPLDLTEDDLRFALLIADRLGGALDSAARYRQQLEASTRVQELADLAQHRASELETVLDTMAEAVYVADTDLRLVRLNSAFARLVGLPNEELAGEPFRQLMDRLKPQNEMTGPDVPDDLPMVRALGGESFVNHVLRITHIGTGTDRFLSISGAPILDSLGRIVAAVNVARDVTEMRELDRLKDEFISVASHEMKTPLTVIKGYSQILTKRLETADGKSGELDMAKRIMDQTNRLTVLTDRLLDVSRIQFGRLELAREAVDLSALVEDVAERLRLSTDGHTLNVSSQSAVKVEADPTRIEQVITNLITNAVKYSPEGTAIDVALEQANGDAVISVRDRGFGIPRERQPQIFQRFYRATTDQRKTGLGLGLYVTKGIVEAHGGKIWFESEEGKGSTFYVRLPAAGTSTGAG